MCVYVHGTPLLTLFLLISFQRLPLCLHHHLFIPVCLPSLPQVTTSAGCFHWNIFCERRAAGRQGCCRAGLMSAWGLGAGRERGGEYKYVSGNTSEHGGDVESQRKVPPLLQVKENTILSLVNVIFCIFLLLCFRETTLPHTKSFCLRSSCSDEEDREDCEAVEGKRERIKAGNLPWLGLTHG